MCADTDAEMTRTPSPCCSRGYRNAIRWRSRSLALVALITSDPSLRRVDQLAAACGLSVRSLQRMFGDYVGVSPKWVMRRARLHEAALRADSGEPVDWAALAIDLGYADQAHLTREFTATIGVPPSRYRSLRFSLRCLVTPLRRRCLCCLGADVAGGGAGVSRASRMAASTSAGWVRICAGRERQHEDAVLGHPALPLERPGVIVRRQVPLVRVDLDRDAVLGPPGVRPGHERAAVSYSEALNSGIGRPDFASRSLRSPSAAERIPSATSVRASRNSADPTLGPALSSADRSGTCMAALHGVGHHRPHVAQAGQAAHGIGDSPRGQGVVQRAERPDSRGHAGGPVQPDEGRVLALPRRRDQDVDELGDWSPDVVLPDGGEPGDHAAPARVQHRGHFLLDERRRPGRGQVDAGQQALPGAAEAETMPQGVPGQSDGYRLPAGDHVKLLVERRGRAHLGQFGSMEPCRHHARWGLTNPAGPRLATSLEPARCPTGPVISGPMEHRCRCRAGPGHPLTGGVG